MTSTQVLVELDDVSVKFGSVAVLSHLTWALRSGENWAVLGNNGSGKTTFLNLVRGDIWPTPGFGHRFYRLNGKTKEGPIGFRETTGFVSSELLDMYRTMGWNLSGMEVVCTGFDGTPLLSVTPDEARLQSARDLLVKLGIEALADRRILGMSHGEAKKILIARAMVKGPRFLFLDEVGSGLDSRSEAMVMDLVQAVVDQGAHVMLTEHNGGSVPSFVTHAVRLRSGCIAEQGPVSDSLPASTAARAGNPRSRGHPALEPHAKENESGVPLIRIENADVAREGKRIVRHITWTVRAGQNWAVLGKNGSGKTTLLKLVVGDLRPVWGGRISRFGLKGPQSIWEVRRRISFVTPDLQGMHVSRQTGVDMVLSGFYGSVGLPHAPTREQTAAARSWFEKLGLESLGDREVRTLSYGQVRALLVMRAVVTNPTVLLLDEPLTGLDSWARVQVRSIVEEFAGKDTSVIYVTHHETELSSLFDHVAVLEEGRMIFQGDRRQWHRNGCTTPSTAAKDADGKSIAIVGPDVFHGMT